MVVLAQTPRLPLSSQGPHSLTPKDRLQIIKGAVLGFGIYIAPDCRLETSDFVQKIEDAMQEFSKKDPVHPSPLDIVSGLKDLHDAFETDMPVAVQKCNGSVQELKDVLRALEQFKTVEDFAYHAGRDLIVNGQDIYSDLNGAVSEWDKPVDPNDDTTKHDWEGFGFKIGHALKLVIVGKTSHKSWMTSRPEFSQVLSTRKPVSAPASGASAPVAPVSVSYLARLVGNIVGWRTPVDPDVPAGSDSSSGPQNVKGNTADKNADSQNIDNGSNNTNTVAEGALYVSDVPVDVTNNIPINLRISVNTQPAPTTRGAFMLRRSMTDENEKSSDHHSIVFMKGLIEGFGKAGPGNDDKAPVSVPDKCFSDTENISDKLEEAFNDIKKGDTEHILAGLAILGEATAMVMPGVMANCEGSFVEVREIVEKQVWEPFNTPSKFAHHISEDLAVNGVSIFADVSIAEEESKKDPKTRDWGSMGSKIGDALRLILVGKEKEEGAQGVADEEEEVYYA